jgi:carbamoyltransferase
MTVVLGLGFTDHETSAALVSDGKLRVAIARERLTRIKRDGKMWGSRRLDLTLAIQYCLEERGLTLDDVDHIVWSHIDHIPAADLYRLLAEEGSIDLSTRPNIRLPHHFAHACCAFYLSPFKEAAVFIADGSGGSLKYLQEYYQGPEPEMIACGSTIVQNISDDPADLPREQESFYEFDGGRWKVLRKIVGVHGGIGTEYGSVSDFLFGDCLDAGKTMGLAPYGRPHPRQLFLKKVCTDAMPVFISMHPEERDAIEGQINVRRREQQFLKYEEPILADFAASIQRETEEALLACAHWLRQHSSSRNLCLAGGVALNCVANSLLAEQAGFDEIFVPPAPGDDGIAVGCAMYGAAVNGGVEKVTNHAFLGRAYKHNAEDLESLGLMRVFLENDVFETIAREIATGAVVAWYQGGAELGPRALGHRSFLADPRRLEMKDYLNKKVKNREPFRPFAPVVLAEAASDYFVEQFPSYFMSFVATVREDKRDLLPSVTHVDATARYQVLREQDNPHLYKLISAFARLTGLPILLNTSFNRAGEPLVETPLDAGRCAIASSADYLVVDGYIYRPTSTSKTL